MVPGRSNPRGDLQFAGVDIQVIVSIDAESYDATDIQPLFLSSDRLLLI